VLATVAATVGVSVVLVLVDPTAPRSEAVRTGALSGGAVVALYALWLNDRRRRTEEARHELEGEKVADERFARLARSTPRYKQTVLDVLCAYLRRPFEHPGPPDAEGSGPAPHSDPEADREREVRLTAQRLISDLLPRGEDRDPRSYHLDLSAARLEHFRLEGRRIGRLTARGARFHGNTQLALLEASKPALFTEATFLGRLTVRDARFDGGVSFQRAAFGAEVTLAGATVDTFLNIATPSPATQVGTLHTTDGTRVDGTVDGWAVEARTP